METAAPPRTELEELREQVATLSRELGIAKRATDLKEIALRRANGFLADRIRDVETLRDENAHLREHHSLPPAKRHPLDPFAMISRES